MNGIDASTISLALWGVFALMALFVLLAALFGFLKGIYKTGLKTILKAVLILIFLFLTPNISNAIGNIPIIPKGSDKVTLQYFIAEQITNTGLVSPTNGVSIYETAIALSNAVIAYAVFFLLMILIQIFISLLTTIFYHGIFRWFLPVESKKEYKARKKAKEKHAITDGLVDSQGEVKKEDKPKKKWKLLKEPAAALGAVQEFIFCVILLAPITALSRIVVSHKDTIDEALDAGSMDAGTKETIDSYMYAVDKSLIYKIGGVGNFDSQVMNVAGNIKLNSTNVSLGKLTDSLFDIASPFLSDGAISFDQGMSNITINYGVLLSVDSVSGIIDKLMANPTIVALIPPLVDVGLNAVSDVGFDANQLDFSRVDWSNDVEALKEIYAVIYDGTVKPMISEDGKAIDPTHFSMKTSTMSDEKIEEYASAVGKLGEMESVQDNLPTILSGVGTMLAHQSLPIFPTEKSAYSDVDWSKELSLLIRVSMQVMKILNLDLDSNLGNINFEDVIFNAFGDKTKLSQLEAQFVGSTIEGKTNEGLLDSQIVQKVPISSLLQESLSDVESIRSYVKNISFEDAFKGLNQNDIKGEFRTIFDIASIVFDKNSKLNIDHLDQVDIGDTDTANELVNMLEIGKNSVLFSRLYPSFLKSFLFNNTFDFNQYLYGLTPYNFNFESDTFLADFCDVLRLMPKIQDMGNAMSDSHKSDEEKLNELDTDTLRKLLNIVINSSFFNSDMKTGTSSEPQKNLNIRILFKNLFKEQPFSDIGFVIPTQEQLNQIDWGNGEHDGKEIDRICSLVDEAKKNSGFFTSENKDINAIQDTDAIGNLLNLVLSSDLLSPSIVKIIDDSLGDYLKDLGIPVNFQNMRNEMWKDDTDEVSKILSLLKGFDFDDLEKIDTDRLNALLTALASTNFIQESVQANDSFGYAVYSLLNHQGVFSSLGISNVTSADFDAKIGGFTWTKKGKENYTLDNKEYPITQEGGTIRSVCLFLKDVQTIGFDNLKDGKIPSGTADILSNVMGDRFVRSLLSSVLQESIKRIDMGSDYQEILSSIDFSILKTESQEEVHQEISLFEKLYNLSQRKYEDKSVLETIFSSIFQLQNKIINQKEGDNDPYYGHDLEYVLDDILTLLGESKLFQARKDDGDLSPLQWLMVKAVNQSSLGDKVTLLDKGDASIDKVLKGLVLEIQDWKKEINDFKTIINAGQGVDMNNLSLANNTLTEEKADSLLLAMNDSVLFHRVPVSLIKDALKEKGIDDLLVDPDEVRELRNTRKDLTEDQIKEEARKTIRHPINYAVHLDGNKAEDVSFWEKEIRNVISLCLGEDGLKNIFKNASASLDKVDLNTVKLEFLYYLGSLEILRDNRSYITYNLMEKNCEIYVAEIFQSAKMEIYGENSHVMRIEELLFENPKLIDAKGKLDEAKFKHDMSLADNVVNRMLDNAKKLSVDITSDTLKDLDMNFESINNGCLELKEDGSLYRSDFASEIVAGVETLFLKNNNLKDVFGKAKDLDLYANGYALVNTLEGRGLNGILALQKVSLASKDISGTTYSYFTKDSLKDVFSLFGAKGLTGLEDQKLYDYLQNQNDYAIGNSKIITSATTDSGDEIVLALPVLDKDGNPDILKNQIGSLSSANSSYASILDAATIQ